MQKLTFTRRDFLKASAVTGAAAAVFSPAMGPLKGLVEAKKPTLAEAEVKVLKSACRSCAHGYCEVLVHVKDGKVVKLEPDPEGTVDSMCSKGQAAIQQLYSPNRIKYPMKRVGARGEGKWQRISWDESLDTISKKWLDIKEKYGPECIIIASGTGRGPDRYAGDRLASNLGLPNTMMPGHFCYVCRGYVNGLTLGLGASPYGDDRKHSNCLVFPGAGLFYPSQQAGAKIDATLTTAKKVIVIDPVFRDFSSKAHMWLPVRPGTDCAWHLAWLNVIIGEDLYERDWVEQWTNAPFLVIIDPKKPQRGGGEDPGPLLTEADIVKDGSPTRYMVWDEVTKSLKYWDATPIPPEPKQPPFPTFVLEWGAPGIKPALFGTYKVTLKDGREVDCKPAWQILWDRVEDWTPEKAAEITWIPADKIREAARTYATTKPASIIWGVATEQAVTMAQAGRIVCFLQAMTGNINVEGGDFVSEQKPQGFISEMSLPPIRRLTPAEHAIRLAAETHPVLARPGVTASYPAPYAVTNALLTGKPYKPKALLAWTSSLICYANQKKYWEAMKEHEFVVFFDMFMSPGCELVTDMVLPTTLWLEDNNLAGTRIRQRTVGPLWECLSDHELGFRLGRSLGLGEYYPWKTEEEFWNDCVKGTGVTFEELKEIGQIPSGPPIYKSYEKGLYRRRPPYADKKPGFATPTGKVEIYSTILKDLGFDPLYIHYIEPHESPYSTPELAREYPLILTTGGRSWHFFHTEQRQIPWLREVHPVPYLYINPETAKGLGIKDNDWVWIESPRGRVRQKAVLYEGIDPRVVHAQHSWWYPEKPATKENPYGMWDSNINVVTDSEQTCAVSAAEPVRGLLCKVYKAVEGAPEGVWTEPEQFKPWLPRPPGGE
jgi:anaerobic selenocysteine-containing dehydrogenase